MITVTNNLYKAAEKCLYNVAEKEEIFSARGEWPNLWSIKTGIVQLIIEEELKN